MKRSLGVLFSVSVLFAAGTSAWAQTVSTVRVLDGRATTTDDPSAVMVRFVVNNENKALGRAWVEVEIDGGYVDADLDREEVFVKKTLPGLKFDPSTNEVVYQPQGADPVVCGEFSDGNIIKWASVKPTGRCKFTTKVEKRPYDDGYYVRQKPYVTVDMAVQ